jgi:hypothetical protein
MKLEIEIVSGKRTGTHLFTSNNFGAIRVNNSSGG